MAFTALQYLIEVHNCGKGRFWSKNNPTIAASNTELRQWINSNALWINGTPMKVNTDLEEVEITSAVLFPKNKRARITLL